MATTVAVFGAGGKMGYRVANQLRDDPAYDMRYVEPAPEGRERLAGLGVEPTPQDRALEGADVVILAVPDSAIGSVCAEIVPELDEGTMVKLLDPAAAHASVLPEREDIAYFISHPCHPSLFHDESDPDAQQDFFGGQDLAKQHIVCALHQGTEADYDRGESIARDIHAPVLNAHRLTTEQMAILEPGLVEMLCATLLYELRRGFERTVELGVPEEAARDFLYGHIRTEAAIIFGEAGFPISDAAQQVVERSQEEVFQPGWEDRLFDPDRIRAMSEEIADGD